MDIIVVIVMCSKTRKLLVCVEKVVAKDIVELSRNYYSNRHY